MENLPADIHLQQAYAYLAMIGVQTEHVVPFCRNLAMAAPYLGELSDRMVIALYQWWRLPTRPFARDLRIV